MPRHKETFLSLLGRKSEFGVMDFQREDIDWRVKEVYKRIKGARNRIIADVEVVCHYKRGSSNMCMLKKKGVVNSIY